MKKTTRNIILFVVAAVLLAALAGCEQKPVVQSGGDKLQVNTIKYMPYAYMGESFDLRDVLLMEEGVAYSATALYVDISTKTEYTLEVNDLCFTPEAIAETVVVITAKRGSETASKAIYIPTTLRAEPLDDLYKSSGELGGSDPGISKSVNIDPLYLKGDNSTTSLHVSFNGTDPHPYGNLFMSLSSPDAQEYFTDKIWGNAIVTFWVYNPMDQDIQFQLRLVDEQAGLNLDWQTVPGPHQQIAKAGEWTQLFFSLRKMGTTHKLTASKFGKDMLSLKFRYDGYSTTDTYSFDFYMDGVDVVDGSVYPDVDTKFVRSNETIEQGWENMKMDTGWQGVYTEYDYEFFTGEGSTCSLKATFEGDKAKTNSFICLSPEAQFDELPDMTGGKLSAYFKFENMSTKVSVDILNKKWETSNKIEMPLRAVGDGWYYGEIDLEDVEVGSGRNDNIIRIRFHFSGVTDDSVVYMDTAIYEYKYVNKVLESISADWINLPTDRGDYYWNVESKYVTNNLKGSNTVRSLYVSAPASAAGKFTFSTQAAVSAGEISAEPNMTYGTLGGWFYFGKQLPNASMRVTSDNWKGSIGLPFVFTQNTGDGWYYGELHGSDIKFSESANASKILRITIDIPKGYTVYLDNLHWNSSYENPLTAAEIDPSVLYDGGDLLASTDVISYDKHHWENVPNDDETPDTQVGLTCGVDKDNIYGPYSVRSWYFKAAADNAASNAVAQLRFAKSYDMTDKLVAFDIRLDSESKIQQTIGMRLHHSGWGNINDINKVIKLNADETWKTVVLDFSDLFVENPRISDLQFISFYFDFATNTGKDRAIYIDNLRLIKADDIPEGAITADETPEPLTPADLYDGGDLLARATLEWNPAEWGGEPYAYDANATELCTEGEVGAYSVKSWKFYTEKNSALARIQLHLRQTFDLRGKDLVFDAKFVNVANQTIGIELFNQWSALQPDNTPIYTVTGDGSDGWQTLTVPAEVLYDLLVNKKHDEIMVMCFRFNFTSETEGERAVYIDNLRIADTDIFEVKSDLLGGAAVEAPDWTPENGLTVSQDTENVDGTDSLRSWAFAAAAEVNQIATVKFDLGENVDMTGKFLVMDTLTTSERIFAVALRDENGEDLTGMIYAFALADEDWTNAIADVTYGVLPEKDLTAVRFIEFYFDFESDTGAERIINIDNVRLIDAETQDDDWIHLPFVGVEGNPVGEIYADIEYLKAENSTISMKFVAPADIQGIVMLDTTGMASPLVHRGTVSAWFYFGEQEPSAALIPIDTNGNVSTGAAFTFGEGVDGWYLGTVSLGNMAYAEGVTVGDVAAISLAIPQGYTVYIDGLGYEDITEDAAYDLIHTPYSPGSANVALVSIVTDKVVNSQSAQSMRVDATTKNINLSFNPTQKLNFSNGKLTAWFYFGENTPVAKVRIVGDNGNTGLVEFTFGEGVNGWYLGTLSIPESIPEDKLIDFTAVKQFVIQVQKGSVVYIDNMKFTPNPVTE